MIESCNVCRSSVCRFARPKIAKTGQLETHVCKTRCFRKHREKKLGMVARKNTQNDTSKPAIGSTLKLQTLKIHLTTRHRSQDCLRAAAGRRGRPLLRPNPQGIFEFGLLSPSPSFSFHFHSSIASASRCFFAKSLHSLYEGHESRISRPGGWNSLVTQHYFLGKKLMAFQQYIACICLHLKLLDNIKILRLIDG